MPAVTQQTDLIWKWTPPVCCDLCQMFKLPDVFLYTVVLICLCEKKIPLILLCLAAKRLVKEERHFSYR